MISKNNQKVSAKFLKTYKSMPKMCLQKFHIHIFIFPNHVFSKSFKSLKILLIKLKDLNLQESIHFYSSNIVWLKLIEFAYIM